MSSVYYDNRFGIDGYYWPWKANDGNRDPIALKLNNSCVHTTMHTNHWWAVDLGVPLYVAGVLFTNRAEAMGNVHVYVQSGRSRIL